MFIQSPHKIHFPNKIFIGKNREISNTLIKKIYLIDNKRFPAPQSQPYIENPLREFKAKYA
jgi:hypothetical protein